MKDRGLHLGGLKGEYVTVHTRGGQTFAGNLELTVGKRFVGLVNDANRTVVAIEAIDAVTVSRRTRLE